MPLRRDILLPVLALVVLNVALAFGAIGLFMRIAPAVEQILRDNVVSMEAAESMLRVLAQGHTEPGSRGAESFGRALSIARNNVTVAGEREVIQEIERLSPRALEGDSIARHQLIAELGKLGKLNHAAMRELDQRAHRLARAGAWAAVFVAVLALAINVIVIRTLERRVIVPLRELTQVLDAARQGDAYRRCVATEGPPDLRRALMQVNELLDERVAVTAAGSRRSERDSALPIERAALHYLLEQLASPTVVLGARGQVMAANLLAMDVLGGSRGEAVHEALVGLSKGEASPLVSSTPFDAAGGLLCTLLVDPEPPRSGPPGSVPPVHVS